MAENIGPQEPNIPKREQQNKKGTDLHTKLPSNIFDEIEAHANFSAEKRIKVTPLPTEFNHTTGQVGFESPEADDRLSNIRKNLAENRGKKPSNYDLFYLIQDESTDIKTQQNIFKNMVKPEKNLLQAAERAFDLPKHKGKTEITLAFEPNTEKKEAYTERKDEMENIVISKADIDQFWGSQNAFRIALKNNKNAELAAFDTIMGKFPDLEKRDALKGYIWRQKNRWEANSEAAKNEDEKDTAQANVNIFNSFWDDIHEKLDTGEDVVRRTEDILQDVWNGKHENTVLTEMKRITDEAGKKEEEAAALQKLTDKENEDKILNETRDIVDSFQPTDKNVVEDAVEIANNAAKKLDEKGKPKIVKRRLFYRKK